MTSKLQTFFALLIILGALVSMAVIADSIGALDILRAQQQIRADEARTRALETQILVIRERQAYFQSLIVSLASAKDSILITLTYIVGGLLLGLACIVIAVLLIERGEHHGRNL